MLRSFINRRIVLIAAIVAAVTSTSVATVLYAQRVAGPTMPLSVTTDKDARFTIVSVESFHTLQKVTIAVLKDGADGKCYMLAVNHFTMDPLQVEPVSIGPAIPCTK